MDDLHDSAALPRTKPAFDQDPHRVRELSERNLEVAIGRSVRAFRRQQGMTVADLAAVTGLSIGMLSKIENGITSPSLTTLQVLSHAFSVPVTAFFKSYEERREVQHVKAGDHIEIERRGTRAGPHRPPGGEHPGLVGRGSPLAHVCGRGAAVGGAVAEGNLV